MKKFYTLLVAAAATLGASAAPTLVANGVATDATLEALQNTAAIEAQAKAPAMAAPTGMYVPVGTGKVSEGILSEITDGIESGIVWDIEIEQSASNPYWYRTKLYNENSPIIDITGQPDEAYFYFNIANKNKVYSDAFIIADVFQVYQRNAESGLTNRLANPSYVESNPAYGKLENGVITFPTESFWVLNEALRKFEQVDAYATFAIAMPGTDLEPAWTDLGEATFVDGIMAAAFTFDGAEEPTTVTTTVVVSENRYLPGIYQCKDAWMEYFGGTKPMYLDITNPACVVMPQQATGFETDEEGQWYFLSRSANVATPGTWDYTTPENAPFNIVCENNLVTFPPKSVFVYWPDYDSEHLYTFNAELTSTLEIPQGAGVNNVTIEDTNAPVEYFNLNGIRVNRPANGVFIMRQGNKVSKIIVR